MGDAEGLKEGDVKLRCGRRMKCRRRSRRAKPEWSYRHARKAFPNTVCAY